MGTQRTLVVMAAALGIVTAAFAQQTSLRPVATVKQLMLAMIVPSSTAVFRAGSEAPKSDGDWTAVGDQALTLAESGNLLMIGSRARDRVAWMKMSVALRDAAEAAARAANARNADALSDASEAIYETCEQCHARYMERGTP